jgi:RNA polymerase sigma-70 factor (family 1)
MTGLSQDEFDRIFIECYARLKNFVYYKAGDMQVSEDIVQDAFMKVWERRDTVRFTSVKPLLYKIANNIFLNMVDHEKVMLKFANDYSNSEFSTAPDYDMEMREFDEKLQKSISALDEKCRIVFLMNRIDDLTYREIAENLGLSQKAVEKRMGKALAFLRERLDVKI